MQLETSYRNLDGLDTHRASLHNHTFKNGVPTAKPSVALGIYRQCGIDIVAITEHDERIHPNRDITEGNVPWRDQDWEHSYDDALLIEGYEATFPDDHVNVLGVNYLDVATDPATLTGTVEGEPGDDGYVTGMQDRGAFVVLNHPEQWNDEPEHVLEDSNLRHCNGIEIYNGNRCSRESGGIATSLWDACLSCGGRFWGLANSDNHRYDFNRTARPTNGWNVVWTPELSTEAVLTSLREGRFYASSGVEVDEITVTDTEIRVRAADAVTVRFIGAGGTVLSEHDEQEATYAPTGEEGYVRVELEGTEKPHPDSQVPQQAWLQPVFVEDT